MKSTNCRTSPAILIFLLSFCLIAPLLFLQGCNGFFQKGGETKQPMLPVLDRIAVFPMDRASAQPSRERPTCLLSNPLSDVRRITPEASDGLTRLLFQAFQDDPRFLIVSEGRCIGFLNSLLATDIKASKLRLIQSFGEELKVDAVLYSKLFRFENRIGGEYSVKRPASVGFTLQIIRVSDGATLWRNTFDETQQALMENLMKAGLYRKTGLRWLTATQLADYGLNRAADELKNLLP
ncbi:MAG: hypothetical protein U9Q89_06970 [Thermodesulfobacteriota bacterium]|nr:hypothetical protein [Thermodesulfobacteriota bacterium]